MNGELNEDRQDELEKIGLKWSVLSKKPWDDMYGALLEYKKGRTLGGKEWDGNVPANYKTADVPPLSLGRWINRQRSSYMKGELKGDLVNKLTVAGLKWCVHERKATSTPMLVVSNTPPLAAVPAPAVTSASAAASAAASVGASTTGTPQQSVRLPDSTVFPIAVAQAPTSGGNILETPSRAVSSKRPPLVPVKVTKKGPTTAHTSQNVGFTPDKPLSSSVSVGAKASAAGSVAASAKASAAGGAAGGAAADAVNASTKVTTAAGKATSLAPSSSAIKSPPTVDSTTATTAVPTATTPPAKKAAAT